MSSDSDCARSSRARVMSSGNSVVPSTAEWLERICSSSVEPARGMPTMKMGFGAGQPPPCARVEELAGEDGLQLSRRASC